MTRYNACTYIIHVYEVSKKKIWIYKIFGIYKIVGYVKSKDHPYVNDVSILCRFLPERIQKQPFITFSPGFCEMKAKAVLE